MEERKSKQVYSHEKQIAWLMDLHKVRDLLAGRGWGKSHVLGHSVNIKVINLPGSLGLLTAAELKQFKGKTLPVMEMAWQSVGLIKDYHYTKFKKKPLYYAPSYKEPDTDNVIWFANGAVVEIVAARQYDAARGGSYDYIEGDEMGFFPEEFYDDIITPSLRGNIGKFMLSVQEFCELNGYPMKLLQQYYETPLKPNQIIKNPFHHQVSLYSSPPKKASGLWVYKFEKLAQEYPMEFSFHTGSAIDNRHAFGEENIAMAQKTMKPRDFDREILGKKRDRGDLLFYFNFDEDIHGFFPEKSYTAQDDQLFLERDFSQSIDPDKPIYLSYDGSGWFNGFLIIQPSGDDEVIHDCLFVKEDSNVTNLVHNFCKKYQDHSRKMVLIYGEPRGHDRTAYGKTIYQEIQDTFWANGWACEIKCPRKKRTELHDVRHKRMNVVFDETDPTLPRIRINRATCEPVITAINFTEVKPDFTKDKSKEKDRTFPQEHAPHFTDMLDYYMFQRHAARFSKGIDTSMGWAM